MLIRTLNLAFPADYLFTTKPPSAPSKSKNPPPHSTPRGAFASSVMNQVIQDIAAQSIQEVDTQADAAFKRTNKRAKTTGASLATIYEEMETSPERKGKVPADMVNTLGPMAWKVTEL